MSDYQKRLQDVIDIQLAEGNWNYNSYMHGLANGLILAKTIYTGEDPNFLGEPDEWLEDRPKTTELPVDCDGTNTENTEEQE